MPKRTHCRAAVSLLTHWPSHQHEKSSRRYQLSLQYTFKITSAHVLDPRLAHTHCMCLWLALLHDQSKFLQLQSLQDCEQLQTSRRGDGALVQRGHRRAALSQDGPPPGTALQKACDLSSRTAAAWSSTAQIRQAPARHAQLSSFLSAHAFTRKISQHCSCTTVTKVLSFAHQTPMWHLQILAIQAL